MTDLCAFGVSAILNIILLVIPEYALSEKWIPCNLPIFSECFGGDSVLTSIDRRVSSKTKGISGSSLSSGNNSPADRFSRLDNYAMNAPASWEGSIKMLADSLILPAGNDLEKARVLFTWVATHVQYDMQSYGDDTYMESTPVTTLQKKAGLCGDFSGLLCELCQAAGLDAFRVSGLTKGFRFRMLKDAQPAHHAWNVIRTGTRWILTDVTWAGSVSRLVGDSITSFARFEPFWFDVDPKAFIFTHFPDSGKWQMLGKEKISYNRFLSLPPLAGEFFKAKFDPVAVFRSAVVLNETGFVKVFDQLHPVKVIKAPMEKSLSRNKKVVFIIESDSAGSIALKENGKWYFFRKAFNTFTLDFVPSGKTVIVTILEKDAATYKRLLEYEIKP